MRREGAPEDELAMGDFLCDFCHGEWTEDRPMVEGHQGSCICGSCLSVAWAELVTARVEDFLSEGETCRLCLEPREQAVWRSPAHEDAAACLRCVKQSAGALHKDPDIPWRKPTGSGSEQASE